MWLLQRPIDRLSLCHTNPVSTSGTYTIILYLRLFLRQQVAIADAKKLQLSIWITVAQRTIFRLRNDRYPNWLLGRREKRSAITGNLIASDGDERQLQCYSSIFVSKLQHKVLPLFLPPLFLLFTQRVL